MPKVNPIRILNPKAHEMITSLITDSPAKDECVRSFFSTANQHDAQCQALLSYYTTLNNLESDINFMRKNNLNGIRNFRRYVGNLIKQNHYLAKNANPSNKEIIDTFLSRISVLYDKTLEARVSIAKKGAVRSDRIVMVSNGTKSRVRINLFLDRLMETGEKLYETLHELCNPKPEQRL